MDMEEEEILDKMNWSGLMLEQAIDLLRGVFKTSGREKLWPGWQYCSQDSTGLAR